MTTWASGALGRIMGEYGDMTYFQGQTYVANGLNQYASVSGTAFSYDGRGNLTSDGARAFTFDVDSRLLKEGRTR